MFPLKPLGKCVLDCSEFTDRQDTCMGTRASPHLFRTD